MRSRHRDEVERGYREAEKQEKQLVAAPLLTSCAGFPFPRLLSAANC